jgi:hypothetical protein
MFKPHEMRNERKEIIKMSLTPKMAQLLSMASMVLVMTMVVVLVSNVIYFGFDELCFFRFIRSWAIAFILAFPLAVVLMPRLQKYFQSKVAKA